MLTTKEFLLLWLLVCVPLLEQSRTPYPDVIRDILKLTDNEFFASDASVLSPREARLLETNFIGVAVNAPEQIDTRRHDTMPLVMALRCSGERDWDLKLHDNTIVVASNLQDGTVLLAPAFAAAKARAARPQTSKGSKPEGLAEVAAQLALLDVRRLLKIDWDSGTWGLGVIYYDWPSNTAAVQLEGNRTSPRRPRARDIYPPLDPRTSLPSYVRLTRTPEAQHSGVSFFVQYLAGKSGGALKVFGAFKVPMRGFYAAAERSMHGVQKGRAEQLCALVPVTFVVLARDSVVPVQFDWVVPAYGRRPREGGQLSGFFAIDALAGSPEKKFGAGQYVCYVIADGRISGPQRFEVPGGKP